MIAFNFPARYHLGFCDVTVLSLLLKAELLLFETIGQRSNAMKSKMAARGKFKSDNWSKSFPFIIIINCYVTLFR